MENSNLKSTIEQFLEEEIENVRKSSGDKKILCALSGGVDSAVCAVLTHKAVGDRLTCLFVDTGLMRKGEGDEVVRVFRDGYSINLIRVNAQKRFLAKLKGVTDPEAKRKIIGEEFIRVFEEEALKLGEIGYLVQGTIYPDIVESGQDGHKAVKAHHNVGGLPDTIKFDGILEPLKTLYKGEVRACGTALGLPANMVNRQPFPGPGLAVRCLGEITFEKLEILREADWIFRDEIEKTGLHLSLPINQYFAVITGIKSVGVRNSERTYEYTIALRAVTTVDFVNATAAPLPFDLLTAVSGRITNEVVGVNRVVYDISAKPPATIEWE